MEFAGQQPNNDLYVYIGKLICDLDNGRKAALTHAL
jgi:hypothetical protein